MWTVLEVPPGEANPARTTTKRSAIKASPLLCTFVASAVEHQPAGADHPDRSGKSPRYLIEGDAVDGPGLLSEEPPDGDALLSSVLAGALTLAQ